MTEPVTHLEELELPGVGVDPRGQWSRPIRTGKVTSSAAARLPRQSSHQTRDDLVDAAVRIVNEYISDGPNNSHADVDLLPFLRLDDVLEVASDLARQRLQNEGRLFPEERIAPLTAGAFYKAFADEYETAGRGAALTAFRSVVTHRMVDDPLLTSADLYIDVGKKLAESGEPWTEAVRIVVAVEFHRWYETPALVLMNALALHAHDRTIGAWTEAVDARQLDQLAILYNTLLPIFGRRLRPQFQVEQMAVAVSDLIAGMALNARFNLSARHQTLELDADGHGVKQWHLCALSALAIYESFTEIAT